MTHRRDHNVSLRVSPFYGSRKFHMLECRDPGYGGFGVSLKLPDADEK
jgi:hypothetical protein